MQGQESLCSNGEYWGIRNMYLTKAQRSSMSRLQQGCDDFAEQGNLNLFRSDVSAGSATGSNAALALVFGKNLNSAHL